MLVRAFHGRPSVIFLFPCIAVSWRYFKQPRIFIGKDIRSCRISSVNKDAHTLKRFLLGKAIFREQVGGNTLPDTGEEIIKGTDTRSIPERESSKDDIKGGDCPKTLESILKVEDNIKHNT